jgi:Flp pilus assembly protein TadG
VEFALIAPVLVLLLVGIVQFGYTFFQYLEVSHAAREGARWAALGVDAGSVGDSESVRGRTAAAAPGLNPGLSDANIAVAGGAPGDPVSVTVSYASPVFLPLLPEIVGGTNFNLQSTATLRAE